ncbi:hypothetical protein CFOL_v3_26661 [Cephalotus follicularis]|uniref:Uncharacterized protein n=1 Tax=Cephalotus follicularis TaxID=3775 RepID=A0A1Q3CSS2_CEPFO|nr:hypothetical protein CFOL_v3_26661 [Cephalotus follicularis]
MAPLLSKQAPSRAGSLSDPPHPLPVGPAKAHSTPDPLVGPAPCPPAICPQGPSLAPFASASCAQAQPAPLLGCGIGPILSPLSLLGPCPSPPPSGPSAPSPAAHYSHPPLLDPCPPSLSLDPGPPPLGPIVLGQACPEVCSQNSPDPSFFPFNPFPTSLLPSPVCSFDPMSIEQSLPSVWRPPTDLFPYVPPLTFQPPLIPFVNPPVSEPPSSSDSFSPSICAVPLVPSSPLVVSSPSVSSSPRGIASPSSPNHPLDLESPFSSDPNSHNFCAPSSVSPSSRVPSKPRDLASTIELSGGTILTLPKFVSSPIRVSNPDGSPSSLPTYEPSLLFTPILPPHLLPSLSVFLTELTVSVRNPLFRTTLAGYLLPSIPSNPKNPPVLDGANPTMLMTWSLRALSDFWLSVSILTLVNCFALYHADFCFCSFVFGVMTILCPLYFSSSYIYLSFD